MFSRQLQATQLLSLHKKTDPGTGSVELLVETRRFELRSNRGRSGRRYGRSLCFDLGSAAPKDRIRISQPSLESRISSGKLWRDPSHLCDTLPKPDDGSFRERAAYL